MPTVDPAAPKPPLTLPDRTLVAATIETRVPVRGQFKALTPLAGDASNRRYFRIELTGGAAHSVILMQLAEPEAFKQSEEAVSGAAHQATELPFLNILSHLSKAGISVPRLYHYDQAAGLLYLEDFGDLTLWKPAVRQAADREARYTEAVSAPYFTCNLRPLHRPISIVSRSAEGSMCRSSCGSSSIFWSMGS